jgi:hypothetical protein
MPFSRTVDVAVAASALLAVGATRCTSENPDPECPAIASPIRVTIGDTQDGHRICGASVSVRRQDGVPSECILSLISSDCEYIFDCGSFKPGAYVATVMVAMYSTAEQNFMAQGGACGTDGVSVHVRLDRDRYSDAGPSDSALAN